jgi:hypothetical protein
VFSCISISRNSLPLLQSITVYINGMRNVYQGRTQYRGTWVYIITVAKRSNLVGKIMVRMLDPNTNTLR